MSKIEDGGPAYPNQIEGHGIGVYSNVMSGGFSKLEAYALAAMQAIINDICRSTIHANSAYEEISEGIARDAFDVAAAMLAEHERRMKEST